MTFILLVFLYQNNMHTMVIPVTTYTNKFTYIYYPYNCSFNFIYKKRALIFKGFFRYYLFSMLFINCLRASLPDIIVTMELNTPIKPIIKDIVLNKNVDIILL